MSSSIDALSGKRILIVDDEELVREVTSMMVEDAGGTVVVACDGEDAVKVFEANKQSLDAVFMDFSMPGLNGFEAFEKMAVMNPAVPVVLVSGLKITPEADQARTAGRLIFLSKPFKQDDVIRALLQSMQNLSRSN